MSRIFFTSDTHFGHRNVLKYCGRPFLTVRRMNDALIKNWNDTVRPEDIVYMLGDFAFAIKFVKKIVPLLNGRKILITGNHDLCHPLFGDKRAAGAKQLYLNAGFTEVHETLTINVVTAYLPNGLSLTLSHFPLNTSHDPYHADKHSKWKLKDNGSVILCGHVHDSWLKKGNSLNVGVDCWDMKPVELGQLFPIISKHRGDIDAPYPRRRKALKLFHAVLDFFSKGRSFRHNPSKNK